MKKIILTGAAFAALMALVPAQAADIPRAPPPSYKAPVMIPDAWSWNGFYIGGNGGYSFGNSDNTSATFGVSNNSDMNGWVAGGQIGFNWQFGSWVAGIEADFQGTGQDSDTTFVCTAAVPGCFVPGGAPVVFPGTGATFSQDLKWFGTVRGRLGFTLTPTVLLYGTGGFAYGRVETNGTFTTIDATGTVLTATAFSDRRTKTGWTAGGGIEARLWGNWTGKIEYLYLDLGSVDSTFAPFAYDARVTDHIVRAGLNYKFNWGGPITARY